MTATTRSKACSSPAPASSARAASAASRDRYQALLDAEVARLTHELRHLRQSSQINTFRHGHQPTP